MEPSSIAGAFMKGSALDCVGAGGGGGGGVAASSMRMAVTAECERVGATMLEAKPAEARASEANILCDWT